MRTKFYFVAALAATMLASCADDKFVGDNSPNELQENAGVGIQFGLNVPGRTRADIYGGEAAKLLGYNFYVMGTKGTGAGDATEPATSPTTTLVFDNYLVHYGVNTAGQTESNTANWEYVGFRPGTGDYTKYVYLTSMDPARTEDNQTIKYWDYSTKSYDFFAFSTGGSNAVSKTNFTGDSPLAAGEIGVTKMNYGSDLTSGALAYTLYIPSVADLEKTYITDIKKVEKADYGKEVQLKFKNIGAKVRVGLYETVPGYSVKEVKFYTVDAGATPSDLAGEHETNAYLIGSSKDGEYSFPSKARIDVKFGHTGAENSSKKDYDIATATVTAAAKEQNYQLFGALNYTGKDPSGHEAAGNIYLGRNLPNPSFAGSADAKFYTTVFPVSTSYPLTLRVDYTLVSTDGSGEEIKVYGAKAVVPDTYTKWLPNYAYTYIFKICDNTNGWTDTQYTAQGLFPITFDAVVTEATDVTGEQTTITTVSTPTITTYQQGHNPNKNGEFTPENEYDNDGANLYVQVMDNSNSPASPVTTLSNTNSLLYAVSKTDATEAEVMDALQNRTTNIDADNVTGRNTITLTKQAAGTSGIINNEVTSIVNGVDDNPITSVTSGSVAEITISSLKGTYAYVYDYSGSKTTTDIYQPIAVNNDDDVQGVKYITYDWLKNTWDKGIANEPTHYTSSSTAEAGNLYFSITTNGGANTIYSFISVDDKIGQALPDGLLKVPVEGNILTGGSGAKANVDNFYFNIYIRNNGKYAVKVIKIVE